VISVKSRRDIGEVQAWGGTGEEGMGEEKIRGVGGQIDKSRREKVFLMAV